MTTTAHKRRQSRGDLDSRVASRLADHGVRYTFARRRIVAALADSNRPMTASQLHEATRRDVPLSSLYRTLVVLESGDIIHRAHDAGGMGRYELAEWLSGHHHHLVCLDCGEVADVELDPALEERMEAIIDAVSAQAGFESTGHRVDIEGRCPQCRS